MKLTAENYFSKQADTEYMSASQYKAFQSCEARAIAELNGEWKREETTSLLLGSYVDAHFEGTLDVFKAKHPELFKRDGSLKSEYIAAENAIVRMERDDMFMKYMSGRKQVIMTGDIDGIPFKIKMDSYHPDNMIVDLKYMKDFESIYVKEKGRLPFFEAWGYDIQGAIYQYIEGNRLPFYIAAATKEKEPDIGIFQIEQSDLDACMEIIRENIPKYALLKAGIGEPVRCEHCDYCKHTKKLSRAITSGEMYLYE